MTLALFNQAKRCIPGGVNSPVRAFRAVGGAPVFIRRAKGKYFWGEDGRKYLDFCLSWGALILGHAPEAVLNAVGHTARKGTTFGAPTVLETRLAQKVCALIPSVERVRFVSTGTEAAMSALRLARAFTRRDLVLKFDGGYHGHADAFLVKAGSGVAGLSRSSSAGVPDDVVRHTLSIPFNDGNALRRAFRKHGGRLAAVIVEPVPANMGVVPPRPGFLEEIRELATRHDALLIFDEVITGFRLSLGGAQGYFGVRPDMTLLGKIIGGGFPAAAFGGRKDIMGLLAPEGPVYQAGTLSGNPVAMAAGLAVLGRLERERGVYARMKDAVDGFSRQWRRRHKLIINNVGSMFTIFYTDKAVHGFGDAQRQDLRMFRAAYAALLKDGLYLPPSMYEAAFVSTAHGPKDLQRLGAHRAFKE